MGTQGLVGFYRDGITKAQYNHFDSYPGGLGADTLRDLQKANLSLDQLREVFDRIVLVDNKRERPTREQQEQCRSFADTSVSEQSLDDWYCLLRQTQGDLSAWLTEGCHYMIDSADFARNSLFCEYAYIVNLDDGCFEVYEGFQKSAHLRGRYSSLTSDGDYYPVALVAEFDLDGLPPEGEVDGIMQQLEKMISLAHYPEDYADEEGYENIPNIVGRTPREVAQLAFGQRPLSKRTGADWNGLLDNLKDALWYVYHEDPTQDGHMQKVRRRCPVLARLTDKQLRSFVDQTHDKLKVMIADTAREFAADTTDQEDNR